MTFDLNDPALKRMLPNGQQGDYLVLPEEERLRGFIRPFRISIKHTGRLDHAGCQGRNSMTRGIAETFARQPDFYKEAFCMKCGMHFPVGEHGEFVWMDGTRVGGKEDLAALAKSRCESSGGV